MFKCSLSPFLLIVRPPKCYILDSMWHTVQFDCYRPALIVLDWLKFQNAYNRIWNRLNCCDSLWLCAVSPFSKNFVFLLLEFGVCGFGIFQLYSVRIVENVARSRFFFWIRWTLARFFFLLKKFFWYSMLKVCLYKNSTPIFTRNSLPARLFLLDFFFVRIEFLRSIDSLKIVVIFFVLLEILVCTSVFLLFVYFVSISRGLNRYDFERLLSGFVVCAVHIYITDDYIARWTPKRAREKERRRTANGRTMCVAKRIPYILTHIPAKHLRPYLHTRWASKRTNKRVSVRVNKTWKERREKDKYSCGMNHLILLGTACATRNIHTSQPAMDRNREFEWKCGMEVIRWNRWCDDDDSMCEMWWKDHASALVCIIKSALQTGKNFSHIFIDVLCCFSCIHSADGMLYIHINLCTSELIDSL